MAKDDTAATLDQLKEADDLRELRQMVFELGNTLRGFGKSCIGDVGGDISEEAQLVVQEGRRVLHEVEKRIAHLEKRAEKSVREHPAAWATGVLGVIGLGLVLGLILRPHER